MSKLIAITGNAGKTTFSFLLAKRLSCSGKRSMIVSTDNAAPSVPYLLKADKKQNHKSLGRVLSLAIIDPKGVLENMQTFKNDNIGILSYALAESKNTYPELLEKNIADLFETLHGLVDYIIVDTQSCQNTIDRYAIAHCDHQLCITTASYKGIAFRTQLQGENITHIIYHDCPRFNPFEDVRQTYKNHVKYILPYCKPLQSIYNGTLLDEVTCPSKYGKLLDKIVKEVILSEQPNT